MHVPNAADVSKLSVIAVALGVMLLIARPADAQDAAADDRSSAAATALPAAAQSATISCQSKPGSREHCAADTSSGVVLVKSSGSAMCLLGKTWGYDDTGVWVSDGCAGEFMAGQGSASTTSAPATYEPIETWSLYEPGKGFLVGRSDKGELSISAYALVRYLNQLPADQSFTDHLGDDHAIDTRNDIYSHRVMVFFKGWLGLPRLRYVIVLWTVNTTDQKAVFGTIGYQFSRKFSLYAGLNGLPGTRSTQGSHPYWLGNDRVMADEFFRPYFTNGVWATGELTPGLWYNAMLGNNNSALGITSKQLTRDMATAGSAWWMPTTHEFGPQGAYGDWEMHEKVATRFGVSTVRSRENRFVNTTTGAPDNTTLRLADSLNVFDTGTLAPGVTVEFVNYRLLATDWGVKYRGFFLQAEIYKRWLDHFQADGPLPVGSIVDKGYYIQGAFYPVPKTLEIYGATSQIYGDRSAGFSDSAEYLGGLNYYPADTRNDRLNVQVTRVLHSPVSSSFGYYVGGEHGVTLTVAFSIFF